jgi:hypothetical protein
MYFPMLWLRIVLFQIHSGSGNNNVLQPSFLVCTCTLGYNGFDFVLKITFNKYVFLYLAPFFARFASKFKKSTNMTFKQKIFVRYQKTPNFMLISYPSLVISKTCLTNMSKSEKSAYFRQVFANNFFLYFF